MQISAIITTCDRPNDMVLRALNSVFNQTLHPFEVIIVDDSLHPNPFLESIVSSYATVSYMHTNGLRNACLSRNLGAERATGDAFAFLDDDDEWLPHKLEKQAKALVAGVGLVYPYSYIISASQQGLRIKQRKIRRLENDIVSFKQIFHTGCTGSTSGFLVTREAFYAVDGFRTSLSLHQDIDFSLRVAQKYAVKVVPEPLLLYYNHGGPRITNMAARKRADGFREYYRCWFDVYKQNPLAHQRILFMIAGQLFWGGGYNYLTSLGYLIKSAIINPLTLLSSLYSYLRPWQYSMDRPFIRGEWNK